MPRKIQLPTKTFLFTLLAGIAIAQTPLSRIQDVLFKADGARFTGTLVIHWNTFDANNLGTVVQQSKTVSVLNGNLQIQLAPNATVPPPANFYSVAYQSDGREQFSETWVVPASNVPLTVAQVRIGASARGGTGVGTNDNSTPIPESSVVGLLADLAQRPTRGPGFGTNAVAVINENGQVETAVGTLGDCVFVDGTAGPCGGQVPAFFDAEIPTGSIDGTNTTFTLQNSPSGSSLMLYRNGVHLTAGSDYTLSGSTITFINNAQPITQDTLAASYRIDPAGNISHLQAGPNVAFLVICSAPGSSTNSTEWSSLGGCDIPALSIRPGDRFEVRFTFNKTSNVAPYDVQIDWGSVNLLTRHAGQLDVAFTGRAEAAITSGGAQISVESWGTSLPFLPAIVGAQTQNGLRVNVRAKLSNAAADSVALSNITVLRYRANY